MIEIILRDDVSKYETKPLFGFTYRQVAAAACAVLVGYLIWVLLSALKVPYQFIGLVIIIAAVIIAVCFMAKIQGMYGSKRLPILIKYYKRPKTVFAQNAEFRPNKERNIFDPITGKKLEKTKRVVKQYQKAAKRAKKETEFYDSENDKCISAKKYLRICKNKQVA